MGNYYLRLINKVVDKQQFYFVSIREYLPTCTKSLMSVLIGMLKENQSKFLSSTIWSGISHRSNKISSLFLVILTSALKFSDFPGVTVCLIIS
jgi:membrane protein DedA with SNARE-associated domain